MTRQVVEVNNLAYTFSSDDEPPIAQRMWAVIVARLMDELTAQPPRGTVTVEAVERGLTPRVTRDGLVGLVGIPRLLFPALGTQSYTVTLKVRAEGYIPRRQTVILGPIPNFPVVFTPAILGELSLHREPTVIRGRAVRTVGNTKTPVAGATVEITGLWPALPPATMTLPAQDPNILSLQPPLYFPRSAATGRLRRREMNPILGQDKHLGATVAPGTAVLALSDRVNLAAGDILIVDPEDVDRTEYLTIGSLDGASTADQPATATLTHPTACTHGRGVVVRKAVPQPAGGDRKVARDALADDTCVFATSLSGLNAATVVEIFGGTDPTEYHRVSHMSVTSTVDGYYRLPPLSRVAQVEIRATGGGSAPVTRMYCPDYTMSENRVDFEFA